MVDGVGGEGTKEIFVALLLVMYVHRRYNWCVPVSVFNSPVCFCFGGD